MEDGFVVLFADKTDKVSNPNANSQKRNTSHLIIPGKNTCSDGVKQSESGTLGVAQLEPATVQSQVPCKEIFSPLDRQETVDSPVSQSEPLNMWSGISHCLLKSAGGSWRILYKVLFKFGFTKTMLLGFLYVDSIFFEYFLTTQLLMYGYLTAGSWLPLLILIFV